MKQDLEGRKLFRQIVDETYVDLRLASWCGANL